MLDDGIMRPVAQIHVIAGLTHIVGSEADLGLGIDGYRVVVRIFDKGHFSVFLIIIVAINRRLRSVRGFTDLAGRDSSIPVPDLFRHAVIVKRSRRISQRDPAVHAVILCISPDQVFISDNVIDGKGFMIGDLAQHIRRSGRNRAKIHTAAFCHDLNHSIEADIGPHRESALWRNRGAGLQIRAGGLTGNRAKGRNRGRRGRSRSGIERRLPQGNPSCHALILAEPEKQIVRAVIGKVGNIKARSIRNSCDDIGSGGGRRPEVDASLAARYRGVKSCEIADRRLTQGDPSLTSVVVRLPKDQIIRRTVRQASHMQHGSIRDLRNDRRRCGRSRPKVDRRLRAVHPGVKVGGMD